MPCVCINIIQVCTRLPSLWAMRAVAAACRRAASGCPRLSSSSGEGNREKPCCLALNLLGTDLRLWAELFLPPIKKKGDGVLWIRYCSAYVVIRRERRGEPCGLLLGTALSAERAPEMKSPRKNELWTALGQHNRCVHSED